MPLAAITPPLDIDMRAVQRDAIVARLDDKAVAKAAADFYLKRGHVNFAYSDKVGAIIATVCKTLGIKIPDQICILGVDNDDSVCNSIHPSLSSIHPDHFGGGKLAAGRDQTLSARFLREGKRARCRKIILALQNKSVAAIVDRNG